MPPGFTFRTFSPVRHALVVAAMSLTVAAAPPVSFRTDVMALISKAGCNAGSCHGNANGKASFKLSLRGEDPDGDFATLTRDQFARRVDPLNPEQSLLLLKATATIAHEGGQRFAKESPEFAILREWIRSGARNDSSTAARPIELRVTPVNQILVHPATNTQINAVATFSDGTERDVTSWAVYEPDKPTIKVSPDGLVNSSGNGETTVIVRYLEQQRPVRLAFIPDRAFRWEAPREANFIDEQVFAKLRKLRMNPSPLAGDEVFLRRVYLDLLGILPTAEEARAFIADQRGNKRDRIVQDLLRRPEYADSWAMKWADLLRIEERLLDAKGVHVFHRWIRESVAKNKPLDEFVREIVSAKGSAYENPPANFYRAIRTPAARAEAAAQVFMGVRLQCAQCHNHPFDRWSQDDYYDWSSIFARVDYKVVENRRRDDNDKHEFKGEQIVFVAQDSDYKNARTGQKAVPRFLGDSMKKGAAEDPAAILDDLGKWLTAADNPFFAKVQVNRIWFHLMGRGLVEPIDDFRPTNPASHPELLDQLAREFVASGYDVQRMIRLIVGSSVYQLDSTPNETNVDDETNFARAIVRRLTAEQLVDCQSQVTGAPLKLPGLPTNYRAAQAPGALAETRGRQKRSDVDQALAVFGKPARLLTCECERSTDTTMGQAFQMISGPVISDLLTRPDNRLSALAKTESADESTIQELYWAALTRPATSAELSAALDMFAKSTNKRAALEDLTWSLLNAKEFVFRR